MTNYTEVDLTEARESDEMFHVGEWVPVASVAIHKGSARVAWQGGGSHTFPVRHGAKFRRAVTEDTADTFPRRLALVANHLLSECYDFEPEHTSGGVWVLVGYKADDTNVVVGEDNVCVYAAGDWQRGAEPELEEPTTQPDQADYTGAVLATVREVW